MVNMKKQLQLSLLANWAGGSLSIASTLIWIVFAAACVADDPVDASTSDADIQKLIQQLASKSFLTREQAMQSLFELGATAESALGKAASGSDREVRRRSKRVLDAIQLRRRESVLAAFKSGTLSANEEQELPGWKLFSEKYSASSAAREIYAKMLESEWQLLSDFFVRAKDQPAAILRVLASHRFQQLQRSRIGYNSYPVGTMLTFFFLAGEAPESFDQHTQLYTFVRHRLMTPLMGNIDNNELAITESKVVRKLVGNWIVSASGTHFNDRLALQTTLQYRLDKEAGMVAERVLTDENSLPISISMAMQSVAIRKDKSQLKLIEPYLKDKTRLNATGQRERQLRDIALPCAMLLYGFEVEQIGVKSVKNATNTAFDYNTIGFISEQDRKKAFEKFEELLKARRKAEASKK